MLVGKRAILTAITSQLPVDILQVIVIEPGSHKQGGHVGSEASYIHHNGFWRRDSKEMTEDELLWERKDI